MGENVVLVLFALIPSVSGVLLALLFRRLRRRQQPAAWLHVLTGNVLLLLTLLGSLCLAGEIYFRFVYDSTDSLSYSKATRRWFARYWITNDSGMRDNINYPFSLRAGTRRVTFLGDSFTAGHGVRSVEDRFPNIIRREHPDWDIQVLAVPGYDTGDELKYMRELLARHYPLDLVVLVYCLNDISDIVPARNEALARIEKDIQNRGWLLRNSYFFDAVWLRISARRNPFMRGYFDVVRNAYQGPLWDIQVKRLAALRDLVASHGGRLAVVTFPFFHALGPNYSYAFVHAKLDALWSKLGVPHLDLLPLYRGYAPKRLVVNPFDAHPNEFAHALAAPVIGDFVRDRLAEPENASAKPKTGLAKPAGFN